VKDLRLELRARNNLLWHAIFDSHKSVAEFCRTHALSQVRVGALLNLKRNPYKLKPIMRLTLEAQRLCEITGYSEQVLFSLELYNGSIPAKIVAEVSGMRFVALTQAKRLTLPPTQEDALDAEDRRRALEEVLGTLTPREAITIRRRFGLIDGEEQTLEVIGQVLGVGTARVQQIQVKALRKMRKRLVRDWQP